MFLFRIFQADFIALQTVPRSGMPGGATVVQIQQFPCSPGERIGLVHGFPALYGAEEPGQAVSSSAQLGGFSQELYMVMKLHLWL